MSQPYIVAFCGLPSSGKSTLINSLIGKRILESGVCRTTLEQVTLEKYPITDDDGCKFIAMDLPGICDSEEKDDHKFNEITKSQIANATLVFFVSDVHKAFITTHEVTEYNKLKAYLADLQKETGKLYHIAIILSKCDTEEKEKKKNSKKKKTSDEISDSDEDSDLRDLIQGVRKKMMSEDIILFNAFGRITHGNINTSDTLKKLVKKCGANTTDFNTKFSIKKYYNNYEQNQEKSYIDTFNQKLVTYEACSDCDLFSLVDKLIDIYDKLNKKNKRTIALSLAVANVIIFKYLLLLEKIFEKNQAIYIDNYSKFGYYQFQHYVYIANNTNMLQKSANLIEDFTVNKLLCDTIPTIFSKFTTVIQKSIMSQIIYENAFNMNVDDCIKFLTMTFFQTGGFDKYNFEATFNTFLVGIDKTKFVNTHARLIGFCDWKLKDYDLNMPTPCIINKNISEIQLIFQKYITNLEDIVLHPMYILKNKLNIIWRILNQPNQTHIDQYPYDIFRNRLKNGKLLEKQIYNSPEFQEIDEIFYSKLVFIGAPIKYVTTNELDFVSVHDVFYNLRETSSIVADS